MVLVQTIVIEIGWREVERIERYLGESTEIGGWLDIAGDW